MTAKAKKKLTTPERIKDNRKQTKITFAVGRELQRGVRSQSGIGIGQGTGGSVNTRGAFLNKDGDNMLGPLGFVPKVTSISLNNIDELDISRDTEEGFSSTVYATAETGSADDIVTITEATFPGQLLFLRAQESETITLKNTGNIDTIGGGDYKIFGGNQVFLQWNVVSETWEQLTHGGKIGANFNMGNFNITGVNQIAFNEAGQTITDSPGGMDFSLPDDTDSFDFFIDGNRNLSIEKFFINFDNSRLQMDEEVAPSNAPTGEAYIFFDSGTGELSIIKDAGGVVSLEGGGASNRIFLGDSEVRVADPGVGGSVTITLDGADEVVFTPGVVTINSSTIDFTNGLLDNVSAIGFNRANTAITTASGIELGIADAEALQFVFNGVPEYTWTQSAVNFIGNELIGIGTLRIDELAGDPTVPASLIDEGQLYAKDVGGDISELFWRRAGDEAVQSVTGAWSTDQDAGSNSLLQVNDLEFVDDSTVPLSTVTYLAKTAGSLHVNVPSGDNMLFRTAAGTRFIVSGSQNASIGMLFSGDIDMGNNTVNSIDVLEFEDNVDTPTINAGQIYYDNTNTGMNFNTITGDDFTWRTNGDIQMTLDVQSLKLGAMGGGGEIECNTYESAADAVVEITMGTAGIGYAVNTGDSHIFSVVSGASTSFNGAQWDFNQNNLIDVGTIVSSHHNPTADGTKDFGLDNLRWRSIYLQEVCNIEEGFAEGFAPTESTNDAIIFCRPEGTDTELRVKFQTGNSVLIATEPP